MSGTNNQLPVSDLAVEYVEELWQDKQSVRVRASCQQQQMRCHVRALSCGCSCMFGSIAVSHWWLWLNDALTRGDSKRLVFNVRVESLDFYQLQNIANFQVSLERCLTFFSIDNFYGVVPRGCVSVTRTSCWFSDRELLTWCWASILDQRGLSILFKSKCTAI